MDNEPNLIENEEFQDVGSFNHSCLQTNVSTLLKNTGKYTVCIELSLDLSNLDLSQFDLKAKEELKPDICIYPKRKINPTHDILKMSEMPLLAIEILSPKQGTYDILEKFKAYFELGIQSCWLVIPSNLSITVYSNIDNFKNFVNDLSDEIIDSVLDIRLPIQDIFE